MTFRDIMFRLGWIHKDDVAQAAMDISDKIYESGRLKGRKEVMHQIYKSSLEDLRVFDLNKFIKEIKH